MTFADMMLENVQLFPKSPFFGAIMCQIIFFSLVILSRVVSSEYADNEKKRIHISEKILCILFFVITIENFLFFYNFGAVFPFVKGKIKSIGIITLILFGIIEIFKNYIFNQFCIDVSELVGCSTAATDLEIVRIVQEGKSEERKKRLLKWYGVDEKPFRNKEKAYEYYEAYLRVYTCVVCVVYVSIAFFDIVKGVIAGSWKYVLIGVILFCCALYEGKYPWVRKEEKCMDN